MNRGLPVGTFATLWLTLFLDLLAFGIILPVTPFYAESFGASPATVTLLSASFSVAQLVCAPWLGRLSDRVGRRPVMLVSIAGSVLAHLTLFLSSTLALVFLARIFAGMSNANVATAHAYVADRVAPRDRARIMGLMGSAIGLGFVLGPAVGGLLSTAASPALPFLVAAILAALNLGMAWVLLPESRRPATVAPRRRPAFAPLLRGSLWRTPLGWLVLVNGGFFVAFAAMESTFALYCEAAFGWGSRNTGLLYVLIGVAILFTQGVLVGRAVAALGERRCLVLGIAVVAGGLVACGAASSVGLLAVGAMAIAVGNGLATPSLSSLVSRVARSDQQGYAQGLAQASSALARVGAPIAAGSAFELFSPAAPLLAGAALLVAVCIPLALRA